MKMSVLLFLKVFIRAIDWNRWIDKNAFRSICVFFLLALHKFKLRIRSLIDFNQKQNNYAITIRVHQYLVGVLPCASIHHRSPVEWINIFVFVLLVIPSIRRTHKYIRIEMDRMCNKHWQNVLFSLSFLVLSIYVGLLIIQPVHRPPIEFNGGRKLLVLLIPTYNNPLYIRDRCDYLYLMTSMEVRLRFNFRCDDRKRLSGATI